MKLRWSTGLTALALLLLPAPALAAEGGVVSAEIAAPGIASASLCASACSARGEEVGEGMSEPDFYVMESENSDQHLTTDGPVDSGAYALFFEGELVKYGHEARGYLRRTPGGDYSLVAAFDDATLFTVEEGADLDLGRVRFAYRKALVAGDSTVHAQGYGGGFTSASIAMKARKLPAGSKVVLRSYGCGEQQTRRAVKRSGSYRFTWKDKAAHRHYGDKLKLVARITLPDGTVRTTFSRVYSVKSFGWSC